MTCRTKATSPYLNRPLRSYERALADKHKAEVAKADAEFERRFRERSAKIIDMKKFLEGYRDDRHSQD